MSDSWIIVIPEDVHFVPSIQAQEEAVAFFKRIVPQADKVESIVTDKPRFIDCGENLSRILCPICRGSIDVDWWSDRLSEEFEADYPLNIIEVPCCHARLSIDKLEYDWPQGIARFSVEAMNPNIADISENDLKEFALILRCNVRHIRVHI